MIIRNNNSPGMAQKMHLRHYHRDSIKINTLECVRTNHTCSKEAVVHYIEYFMKEKMDRFSEITEKEVMDIKSSIMSGSYQFSSLRLTLLRNNNRPCLFMSFFKFKFQGYKDESFCLVATKEDELVLMALGHMLLLFIKSHYPISDNSLGFRCQVQSFYEKVCSRGEVSQLYKLDLSSSVMSINRSLFLKRLFNLVRDQSVMELITRFINLPVIDTDGCEINVLNEFSIPPIGYISYVLLDYVLDEFDKEMDKLCPSLVYTRYVNEIYISCAMNNCCLAGHIVNTLHSILNKLSLAGQIQTIEVGDEPVPCFGGLICVSHKDGRILFESKERCHHG